MSLLRTAGHMAVASSVHGRVQRRQRQRWAGAAQAPVVQQAPMQQVQQAPMQQVQQAPPPAPAEDPMARKLAQLTQLAELKAAGILTDAEFEAKKALILHG